MVERGINEDHDQDQDQDGKGGVVNGVGVVEMDCESSSEMSSVVGVRNAGHGGCCGEGCQGVAGR